MNGVKALHKCFTLTQSIDPAPGMRSFISVFVRAFSVGVIAFVEATASMKALTPLMESEAMPALAHFNLKETI